MRRASCRAAASTQDSAPGTQHSTRQLALVTAPGTWHLAPGTWHLALGTAPGTQHEAPSTTHRTRHLALGTAPGTQHEAPSTLRYDLHVFQRRTSGSVVCPSCGSLVGVLDDKCYSCGRSNPGLWGFAPLLRQLGTDLGFVPFAIGASSIIYVLTLLMSGRQLESAAGGLSFLAPSSRALLLFGMT